MDYWPLVEKWSYDITAIATIITAAATIAVAIATAVMVRATKKIARVSQQTLKAGTTPQVVAYLKDHFHDRFVPEVTVVIENLGQGAAQNVKYKMNFEDEESKKLAKKNFIANKTGLKIDFLPQGAKREMMFSTMNDLYDEKTEKIKIPSFSVTVQYENLEGEPQGEQSFTLNVRDFEGIGGMQVSSLMKIAEALQSLPEIEQQLGKLTNRQ